MFGRRVSNLLERVTHANRPVASTLSTKTALESEQTVHRPLADAIETATTTAKWDGTSTDGLSNADCLSSGSPPAERDVQQHLLLHKK